MLPSLADFTPPRSGRAILVDIGANLWHASPKVLLDMYAPFLPFTDAYLVEPSGSLVPPRTYDAGGRGGVGARRRGNGTTRVHHVRDVIEVGTRHATRDLVSWLPRIVGEEDFVALKFDVDDTQEGATVEWGFLADLCHSPALGLVDELFVELHFDVPSRLRRAGFPLGWRHRDHTMWQAFDLLRELRRCGVAVHAWP